jgi:hypothetical protein
VRQSVTLPVSFFPPVTPNTMSDWRRVITAGANVLLEGDRHKTDAAILHLLPHLRAPIVYRQSGDELSLLNECTVILRDVDTLCEAEQQQLCDWLGRQPETVRTVATTERPLYALVQCGRFQSDLYYRLNVILLRLDVEATHQQ